MCISINTGYVRVYKAYIDFILASLQTGLVDKVGHQDIRLGCIV